MESLAVALMFIIVLLLGFGALIFGLLCTVALLHGVRASVSRRSARAARWVGLADMLFGLVATAVALTRTGSVGLGALNFNVLAAIGASVTFAVGCFAFARSWAGPGPESTIDDGADKRATFKVYPRAALSALAFAFVATLVERTGRPYRG